MGPSHPVRWETEYERWLEHNRALLRVWFRRERDAILEYSVVLILVDEGERHAVRSFDNAHGLHEFHRYSRGRKQPGEQCHDGTAGEAMRTAIGWIDAGWRAMIGEQR